MVCNYQESFVHSFLPHRFSAQSGRDRQALLTWGGNRIAFSVLLASISGFVGADDSVVQQALPLETVVVSPAVQENGSLVLQAPSNHASAGSGTDNDVQPDDSDTGLRVAKRPWLLEKLVGPEKVESIKMQPPQPPEGNIDPPSVGRITPPNAQDDQLSEVDQWVPRQSQRVHAKPADQEALIPLTDAGIVSAGSTPNLRPLKIENSKPLKPNAAAKPNTAAKPKVAKSEAALDRENLNEKSRSEPQVESIEDQSASNRQYMGSDVQPHTTDTTNFDFAGFPKQPIKLTRGAYQMRSKMYRCLRSYYADMEVASGRSNWGMMHAMMVYGIDTKVIVDRRTYSTIAWIAGNNVCRGQRLFEEQNGQIVVKSGVGLQGHDGQLLTVFSLCGVPANYPIYAGDKKFAVQDIVESEMLACKSNSELTFILIALSHYLDTDQQWLSSDGQTWDFERLIREELSQPVVGAACGGSHRLMGYGHALRQRRFDGKPIEGQWKRAEQFVDDFVQYTYKLQNRDGSFSTDWFEGREDNGDLDRKVQTTGHMVEWLLTVTPNSQLQNPRLTAAIRFLLESMDEERDRDWSIGPKGHALRSLAMYYDRVYQSPPPWQNTGVANRNHSKNQR
jgi:hypothetical protein